jgi:hypothetical protein
MTRWSNPSAHPSNFRDLTGSVFGRLTALTHTRRGWLAYWVCRCECGQTKTVRAGHLTKGKIRSCGCLSIQTTIARCVTHGKTKTREYETWCQIKARCYNPKSDVYRYYGGRGIRVCDRWRESFSAFFEDMGLKPSARHSIERRDVNGHYEPANCYWATWSEQNANKRNSPKNRNPPTKTVSPTHHR